LHGWQKRSRSSSPTPLAQESGKIIAHPRPAGSNPRGPCSPYERQEAGAFRVHRELRPRSLVTFMTSGPCMPMVLQRQRRRRAAHSNWRN
jgi:hypothetical protein